MNASQSAFTCAVLLLAALSVNTSAAPTAPAMDAGLPAPASAGRYAKLAKVSLFAPPTAAAASTPKPSPPPQPTWAEGWKLTSLAEIGTGRYRLGLTRSKPAADSKTADRIVVISGETNSEGITLAGVQWSAQPGQTRVTLNRSGVFAVFNFDPTSLLLTQGAGPGLARPAMTPGQSAPAPLMNAPPGGGEIPQRAGTRTGPIPSGPAPPAPPTAPARIFQPPANSAPVPIPAPGNNAGDENL